MEMAQGPHECLSREPRTHAAQLTECLKCLEGKGYDRDIGGGANKARSH